ncbi:MAG: glycosyltransferase [Erysipelotrichaceae bacterium]
MKITIFALHLGFGGVERYVSSIANILSEEHEVEIISTYQITSKPAFFLNEKVKVSYLLKDIIPNQPAFKEAMNQHQILNILREGCKSIHILYLRKHANIKAIKACRSDVIISTRIFHNELIEAYANQRIIKIATEHNHPDGNEKYIKDLKHSCLHFDYLLPISKELTSFYENKFSDLPLKVIYIPFSIEVPNQYYKHSKTKELINVGRLSSEKGTIELIELFYELYKEDKSIRLHIVGSGLEENKVKERIKVLNLNNAITLHGFLKQKEINELYKQSDIFVMTSFRESFGIVLLEAMAYGVICVAYDSAQGAKEIINEGYNGYLIQNRNRSQMKQKLFEILEDNDRRNQLSYQAYESVKAFDYSSTRRAWLSFIKNISFLSI